MKANFEETLKRLSPTLRRITWKMNGHFTFVDHDDLLQEAMEHLWVAYNKGTLEDKTDSYILQGCYFHLKNYLRKTIDKAKLVSLQQLLENGERPLEEFLGYEDKAIEEGAESASIKASRAMGSLTPRERQVLELSLKGHTVREIGMRLGISHVMVVKMRKKMRRSFDCFRTGAPKRKLNLGPRIYTAGLPGSSS